MSPPHDHQRTQQITLHPTCALHSEELRDIKDTLHDMRRRLFIDNGEPCLQSKVRRVTDITNALVWVVSVVTVALIGALVTAAVGGW